MARRNPEHQRAYYERLRHNWAEKVARLIDPLIPSGDDDQPISGHALAETLALDKRSVGLGIAYLRDHPRAGQKPLLSGPRGYIRSLNKDRATEYQDTIRKHGLTLLKRSRAVLEPYLATLPTMQALAIRKAHARLIEDMADAPSVAWVDTMVHR